MLPKEPEAKKKKEGSGDPLLKHVVCNLPAARVAVDSHGPLKSMQLCGDGWIRTWTHQPTNYCLLLGTAAA